MQTYSKKTIEHLKTAKPILIRLAVFLVCFMIASGIIGPRIISHGLVDKYGFQIYGGTGKALLFGTLAFVILLWQKKQYPKLVRWKRANLLWLIGSIILLMAEWNLIGKIIDHQHSFILLIAAHALIIAAVLLLFCFSFGIRNIYMLLTTYKKELLLSVSMAIVFIAFLYLVYSLWATLASLALGSVKFLLKVTGIHATYSPPQTLILSKFGINISKYCSGIDSIALFTGLYGLIGILDWHRFNHKRYLLTFLPALIVLFGFNILRIFVLILGGYYINPQIAFSLFHTYAGMLFFIIYSLIFWASLYSWFTQQD